MPVVLTMPDAEGRCGACGWANFTLTPRHGVAVGYKCNNPACGAIKPVDWRERAARRTK